MGDIVKKIGNRTLVINDTRITELNAENQVSCVWVDTDKNGKYDTLINYSSNKEVKRTKFKETKDMEKNIFQKSYIKELEERKKRLIESKLSVIKIDGKIGSFQQSNITWDCWALAGIKSLADNKIGAEIIKNSISLDKENGTVTVKLKGVNESYTFTLDEIYNKLSTGQLSNFIGDDDVKVLEMAMEKHRKKSIEKFNQNRLLNLPTLLDPKNRIGDANLKAPLDAGASSEVFAMLTDNSVSEYFNNTALKIINPFHLFKSTKQYLSYIQKNSQNVVATTYFKNDVNKEIVSYHEYSIKKVDNDHVELINPWDSEKIIKIKKEDFIKNCAGFDICDLSKKDK